MPDTVYEGGTLYHLNISNLKPDPDQPRKHFDKEALNELTESIKVHGVLQPVLFTQTDKAKLVLVSGERRYRAAKKAGLETIPALFTDGNPKEIALVENVNREDLNPIEQAEAMQRLINDYDYTHERLAQVLGKGRSTITELLSLTRLPEEIRSECRNNPKCPKRVLVEIAKKKQERAMVSLYEKYKAKGLTSDEIRKSTRGPRDDKTIIANKSIKAFRQKLETIFASEKWTQDDRAALAEELKQLKALIDKVV